MRTSGNEVGVFRVVVLVAGALLISSTHERRVAKMAGLAGNVVYDKTRVLWSFAGLALASTFVAAMRAPNADPLFPVAMVIVGVGFAQWGAGARFAWFVWLGAAIVVAGLFDVVIATGA